jgi:hypothetical protein
MLQSPERVDDTLQFIFCRRRRRWRKFGGDNLRNIFGYAGDLIEHFTQDDKPEKGKNKQSNEINRDVFVVQDIVLHGEIDEPSDGYQKEQAEDDGKLVIEPMIFNGEILK